MHERAPVFFGGTYDGMVVPIVMAGAGHTLHLPTGEDDDGELIIETYHRYYIASPADATTAWLPAGTTPDQFRHRIRLYLESGVRTHPRAYDWNLAGGDN